jgi:hypothetical protein
MPVETTYLVTDPQNSDAGYGLVGEAELWIVNEDDGQLEHTGTALDDGKVESRVKLNDLIDAAVKLFSDYEYSGKVAVVESADLADLQRLLRNIGEDV